MIIDDLPAVYLKLLHLVLRPLIDRYVTAIHQIGRDTDNRSLPGIFCADKACFGPGYYLHEQIPLLILLSLINQLTQRLAVDRITVPFCLWRI
ncbi:hypothetical protein D3C75_981160 [compost metagenome]